MVANLLHGTHMKISVNNRRRRRIKTGDFEPKGICVLWIKWDRRTHITANKIRYKIVKVLCLFCLAEPIVIECNCVHSKMRFPVYIVLLAP